MRLLWRLPPVFRLTVAGVGLSLGYLAGPMLSATPLAIGTALPCVGLLLVGAYATKIRHCMRQPGLVGSGLLLISAALVMTGISHPVDIKVGDFGTPVVSLAVAVAISFGLVLIAETLFLRVPDSVNRATSTLASAGFVVVLLHPLIIWAVDGRLGTWTLFLLALLVPFLVGLTALRTPASGWLTGVKPRASVKSKATPVVND